MRVALLSRRVARLVAAAGLAVLTACGTGAPTAAAVVNGEEIPLTDVRETFEAAQQNPQLGAQIESDPSGEASEQLQAQIVQLYVQEAAIRQAAADLGVEVTDEDVQQRVDELLDEAGGAAGLPEVLSQSGALSEADLRVRIRLEALLEAVSEELAGDAEISDEDIATFYREDAQGQFAESATVRAIVVESEDAAQQVVDRLEAGEDFAALAAELSLDPSGQSGGELPPISQGQLPPELDEPVFDAEAGDVLGPLPIQDVFVVLEVIDRQDKPALAEVEEDIRAQLVGQQREEIVGEWVREAVDDAEIAVNPRFGEWNAELARVEPVDPLGDTEPVETEPVVTEPAQTSPTQAPPTASPS